MTKAMSNHTRPGNPLNSVKLAAICWLRLLSQCLSAAEEGQDLTLRTKNSSINKINIGGRNEKSTGGNNDTIFGTNGILLLTWQWIFH
jgi:hypothetical protein